MSSPRFLFVGLFLVVCASFPTLSFGSISADFSNPKRILQGASVGMTRSSAPLVEITGEEGGGLVVGGGSFTIADREIDRLASGTLFNGAFSDPVTWSLIRLGNGTHNYLLTGVIIGTIASTAASVVTVQLTIKAGKGYFTDSTEVGGADSNWTTSITSVPEPGTLTFFVTGISGMFGVIRRHGANR